MSVEMSVEVSREVNGKSKGKPRKKVSARKGKPFKVSLVGGFVRGEGRCC